METVQVLGKAARDSFFTAKPNAAAAQTMFFVILFIIFISLLTYVVVKLVQRSSQNPIMSPDNVALLQGQRQAAIKGDTELVGDKSLYKDLVNNLAVGERYLVNLCPLTASLGGYVGAGDTGVFYSEFYLQNALRAGIRSFILPIGVYYDDNKRPPNWPISGDPAIVARDVNGKVISLNGLSVKQFCIDLMRYNSQNPTQSSEPILLFITETEYLPKKVSAENKYATILSKLASELNVIPATSRLTTIGGYGSAVGSQNEANILTQIPLSDLQGKILIFTNFDTSIGLKPVYSGLGLTLNSYTNFTLKPVIAQNAGLSVGNGARSIKLADISGSTVNWTDQARTVIHAATGDYNLTVPDSAAVDGATKKGIQVIPVPFYTTVAVADIKPIWDLWKGYAWRLKEPDARYLKPDPVVPAKPSTKMNARIDSNLQPGQMGV
jgi:hypothetical protein